MGEEAPKQGRVHIYVEEKRVRSILDPCSLGHHRWAWLNDGRQACGYCGRPR